jgi:hypothetical protein
MKTEKTFNEQVEAQSLITNINLMRLKIGVPASDFDYLWKQSIEWLRNEQETLIQHYNEALKNGSKVN